MGGEGKGNLLWKKGEGEGEGEGGLGGSTIVGFFFGASASN